MYGRALSEAEGRQSSSARKRYQLTAPWCDTARRTRCCLLLCVRRESATRYLMVRAGQYLRRHRPAKIFRTQG
ncbi:hypothetical protein NDU88_006110 [Pleurodeles waltl]|uniref:Uncharacterized protein n=1 Tax=Pleurodeles waltl TaxID=8319 RepID=A0AAV7WBI2_PLEWA|nr:hypothetical protein NDU88_006110 [Pleurodeles waltl]